MYESLTTKEKEMVKFFLMENGACAETAGSLLNDNCSCQRLGRINKFYKKNGKDLGQIPGVLGSLVKKGVLEMDDDEESNLYWVSDSFLETLESKKRFEDY